MSGDLIASLRALAAAQHADLSLAADAVIEIERMTRERDEARAEVERLREVLLHISRYETVGPAGFEWDIVVEELVTIARDALEGKP